jgi:hypothetical protein
MQCYICNYIYFFLIKIYTNNQKKEYQNPDHKIYLNFELY